MKIFFILVFICVSMFADKITTFKVDGMHCPLCTTAVKKAVRGLEGVKKVSARLNTKEVKVIYEDKVKIADIKKAIKTTSYEGVELSTSEYGN